MHIFKGNGGIGEQAQIRRGLQSLQLHNIFSSETLLPIFLMYEAHCKKQQLVTARKSKHAALQCRMQLNAVQPLGAYPTWETPLGEHPFPQPYIADASFNIMYETTLLVQSA